MRENFVRLLRKSRLLIPILTVVALLLCVCCGCDEDDEASYYDNMQSVVEKMEYGAEKAETAGNFALKVWYNAIHQVSDSQTNTYTKNKGSFVDFNEALDNLYSAKGFSKNISELDVNLSEVTALMKKLNNPQEEYKEAYSELKKLYLAYGNLLDLVINLDGSYNSVSEKMDTYIDDFLVAYHIVSLYID